MNSAADRDAGTRARIEEHWKASERGDGVTGVTYTRRVARTGVLAELTREELVGYLVPAIRALLAPAIAAAEVRR